MTAALSARRVVAVVLVLAGIVLCVTTDQFLTLNNGRAILASTAVVGMAAVGLTFATVVGSAVSLATAQSVAVVAMVFLATQSWGLVPALLAAAVTGAVVGGVQGLAVGFLSINPVVLSIVVAFALTGLATLATGGRTVNASGTAFHVLNSTPAGVPLSVYAFVLLVVVSHLVLRFSRVGRQIHLVGENRSAANAGGLPVGWIVTAAWLAFGLLTAAAGVFLAAFTTSATINVGGSLTFDTIAAVLAGGTAISGGRGSVVRTLVGVVVISIISDVLLLRGFPTGAQTLVKGLLVLVFVVAVQAESRRRVR